MGHVCSLVGSALQPELYFPGLHLVHIAPDPGLAGLNGPNQRMFHRVKMLGGMLVLGRIAAADMAAGKA